MRYERVARLLDSLRIARGDGSLVRRLAQIAKTDLLILDDFALKPLAQSERHDLLEIIEDRHAGRSTLVASQLPIARWHEYLAEPTVAGPLLDPPAPQRFQDRTEGRIAAQKQAAVDMMMNTEDK